MDQIVIFKIIIAGLSLGLAGSFHCLGMCGPLILAMHGGQKHKGTKTLLLHHFGRAIAYTSMLIAFWSLGISAKGMGWQQGISIIGGVVFILGWIPSFQKWMGKILFPLRQYLQVNNFENASLKTFVQGLINGYLPCGWSISAIGAALIYGSWEAGVLFILFFVIGNTPVLWATALGGQKIIQRWPWINQKWAKTSLMIIGLLFILRGANLGIPYLSPKMEKEKMSCCETH